MAVRKRKEIINLFPFYIFPHRTYYISKFYYHSHKIKNNKTANFNFFLQFIINGSEGGGVKNLGVHVVIKCFDTVSVIISPKS